MPTSSPRLQRGQNDASWPIQHLFAEMYAGRPASLTREVACHSDWEASARTTLPSDLVHAPLEVRLGPRPRLEAAADEDRRGRRTDGEAVERWMGVGVAVI